MPPDEEVFITITIQRIKLKSVCLAIFACLLWASAFAVLKISLNYWRPLTLAGVRFIVAGALLIPFWLTRIDNPLGKIRQHFWQIAMICLLQTVLLYTFFNFGISLVPGAVAAIVTGSSPLLMAVIAHLVTHDDKLSRRKLCCLIIGFSGIVIIAINRMPWQSGNSLDIVGIILLLLAGVSGAFGNLAIRQLKLDPFMLNSVQIFSGGIILLIAGLWSEGVPKLDLPWVFYVSLTWLALLSACAFSIWFYLLQMPGVKPSELAMWKFIIPVFGAILSWVLLPNESPGISELIGMVCVAGALLFYYFEPSNWSRQNR